MSASPSTVPKGQILPAKLRNLDVARRLRDTLRQSGFTFRAAVERLGIDYKMWSGTNAVCQSVSEYLSRPPVDRFDVLLRFLTLGVAFDRATLDRCLSWDLVDGLCDMNLAVTSGDSLHSPLSMFECEGLIIVTDSVIQENNEFNLVMPLKAECYELASSVIRKRVGKTLDLCTGSGIHALLSARHSSAIRGVDISHRAIAFAEFNLWLNEIDNVAFDQGDLFEPVEGETFDLILANPPYEPVAASDSSPGDNYYCGGPRGDAITSRIFGGLHRFLRPDGICHVIHMMVSFDHAGHEGRLRKWLGPIASEASIIVLSRPINFRSQTIADATSVDFGITSVKRLAAGQVPRYYSGSFARAEQLDIAQLFEVLERKPQTTDKDIETLTTFALT
jgi:hypothetical protein